MRKGEPGLRRRRVEKDFKEGRIEAEATVKFDVDFKENAGGGGEPPFK